MRKLLPALALFLVLCAGSGAAQEGEGEAGVGIPPEEEVPVAPLLPEEQETRWYRSNSAGMALERSYSRAAALRNRYSLSVGPLPAEEIPERLEPYYTPAWRAELRVLYEDGRENRRQIVFKDFRGLTRLLSVLLEPEPEEEEGEGEEESSGEAAEDAGDEKPAGPRGFIERFDEDQLLVEAYQLMGDGSEYITRYFYHEGVLLRAETLYREAAGEGEGEEERLVSTDYYRYTRSNSLRLVERIYHRRGGEGGDDEGDEDVSRFRFPPLAPNMAADPEFVRPAMAYSSDFLQDIILGSVFRVIYTTDDKGRVLTETRLDENGRELGVIRNTWSGNRLIVVEWNAGEDERRTEYEYDEEGNRILERNYNKGRLERLVRREGNREVEELYMNEVPVLRAIWEDGRKISEDRLPFPGSRER